LALTGLENSLELIRRQVRFRSRVDVLGAADIENGEVGGFGQAGSLWRRHAVWTDWLLREVAARQVRGDIWRAVDTIEGRTTGDGKEQHAGIFANLLQASRIDWYRAVETEARSFQNDFRRECSLVRGRRRFGAFRNVCLGGLGRLCLHDAGLVGGGTGRRGFSIHSRIGSWRAGLGSHLGALVGLF
jgi:hypothetical protein